MQLEASIKTVTYFNAQNGFSVLRCEVEGEKGPVTVTGTFPELQPGEAVKLEGTWSSHPKFGRQFVATRCETTIPSGGASLVAYLSSGLFKGMGKTTATRLVEKFASRTLEVLDSHPEELQGAIRGFTGRRLQNFLSSWKAMRDSRETLLFLRSPAAPRSGCGTSTDRPPSRPFPAIPICSAKRFGASGLPRRTT